MIQRLHSEGEYTMTRCAHVLQELGMEALWKQYTHSEKLEMTKMSMDSTKIK